MLCGLRDGSEIYFIDSKLYDSNHFQSLYRRPISGSLVRRLRPARSCARRYFSSVSSAFQSITNSRLKSVGIPHRAKCEGTITRGCRRLYGAWSDCHRRVALTAAGGAVFRFDDTFAWRQTPRAGLCRTGEQTLPVRIAVVHPVGRRAG